MKNWIAILAVAFLATVSLSARSADVVVSVVGGAIKVSDEVKNVPVGQGVLKWELEPTTFAAGYRFPDNGISQGDAPATPPSGCTVGNFNTGFHNCGPKQGGKEFHCNRKPPVVVNACYKYMVRLIGGGPVPPLDPWIKNQ